MADLWEQQFEKFRRSFEEGEALALHEAILLAIWNRKPVPEWAVPHLEIILEAHANGDFKRRQGERAPYKRNAAKAFSRTVHFVVRFRIAENAAMGRTMTMAEVFEEVAEYFREIGRKAGDERAHVNASTVKNIYYAESRADRSEPSV